MGWSRPKLNWNPGDGIMASDLNRIEGNIDELRIRVLTSVTIGGIVPYDTLTSNMAYITGITTVHINEFLQMHLRSVGDFANGANKFAFVSFHKNTPTFSIGDSGGAFTSYTTLKNSSSHFFDFGTDMTRSRVSLADLGLTEPDSLVVCCGVVATASYQSFKGSVMVTLFEERDA